MFSKEKLSTLIWLVYEIAFSLIPGVLFSQNSPSNTSIFICRVINNGSVYTEPGWTKQHTGWSIKKDDIVYVSSVEKNNAKSSMYSNDEFVFAYKYADSGYIDKKNLIFTQGEDYLTFLKNNPQGKSVRDRVARAAAVEALEKEYNELKEAYAELDKKGLVVTAKDYIYPDFGSTIGMTFNFYNGYKNTIKYINITVQPYNRVGDPMSDDIGKSRSIVKVIGPIKYGNESSVDFADMYLNKNQTINCIQIKKIEVIFMDNKAISIIDINKHLLGSVSNCKTIKKYYR